MFSSLRDFGSFCVVIIDCVELFLVASAGGPFLCLNKGPTLIQELSPSYLRTRVGSSVTWSCEAVGETLPQYRWSKNYEVTSRLIISMVH